MYLKPSTASDDLRPGDRVRDLGGEYLVGRVVRTEGALILVDWLSPESDVPVRAWLGEAWVKKI